MEPSRLDPARENAGEPRCGESPSEAFLRGVAEFNQGLFFEQHETFEDMWIEESDDIRYLYQGILQVGVGFLHLSRGNFRGAISLLQRGMGYLQPFTPNCIGVDISRLIRDTTRAYDALLRAGPNHMSEFDRSLTPRIYLISERRSDDRSDV
jgi:uncharacterized protein